MRRRGGLKRQRGVAVVTALLLVTLAVTIVASLFWQQQVQVRSVENQRLHLQTRWILRGALDWARLILRQDGLDNQKVTRADGVWATPLAETRLDQYVERERVEGEDYDATLQGQIFDAQARYNLANLVSNGTVDAKAVQAFQRLLDFLGLDSNLAQPAANLVLRTSQAQQGTGNGQMALMRVEDLSMAGFPQAAVEKLRDYVIVLDPGTPVNVNTAPAEVMAAIVQGMSLSEAQSIVSGRRKFFNATTELTGLGGQVRDLLVSGDVHSDHFLVLSQVRLDRAALESWALLRRDPQKGWQASVVWIREI